MREDTMQLARSEVHGPLHDDILSDFRAVQAPTRAALDHLAKDDTDMKVSEDGHSRPQASVREALPLEPPLGMCVEVLWFHQVKESGSRK